MLEPQSLFLFALLVVAFGGLMWWMIRTRRTLTKIAAALIAFVVAMQFGIMVVNRYFDYYQTWGAAIADLTSSGPAASPVADASLLGSSWRKVLDNHTIYPALAMHEGYTLSLRLTGPRSHISRQVYVYLPPQYFQPAYQHYLFPVIELIHGQPGEPQDWINVVGITATMDQMVNAGTAKPAVLVMPDANGGQSISLQCLNQVHGPQDLTYLGFEVPDAISHMLRVQPPGPAWGIAGYSEGGYCAANMALQAGLRRRYGFAASLSGYFSPFANKLADGRVVSPFGHDKGLRLQNTPRVAVQRLKPGTSFPQFWLGAGKGDKTDVAAAEFFWQELEVYQASVPLVFMPGGHTMAVWRAEIPPMLQWMTNGLAQAVAKQQALNVRLAAKRAHQCRAPTTHPKSSVSHGRRPLVRHTRAQDVAICRASPPTPARDQAKHRSRAPVRDDAQAKA